MSSMITKNVLRPLLLDVSIDTWCPLNKHGGLKSPSVLERSARSFLGLTFSAPHQTWRISVKIARFRMV